MCLTRYLVSNGKLATSGWLSIGSSNSGTGNATVSVSVNPQGLAPGTYKGKITVSASDNSGTMLVNSPQTINVSLVVTGYTLSGTVMACPAGVCATPLPGATVTLTNSANKSVNATANSSGNYSFGNLATGTYTLTASGSIGTLNYLGYRYPHPNGKSNWFQH